MNYYILNRTGKLSYHEIKGIFIYRECTRKKKLKKKYTIFLYNKIFKMLFLTPIKITEI